MASYLTLLEFKTLSLMRTEYIDDLELSQPGFVDARLAYWTNMVDARLRKRYAVPFVAPFPDALRGWLANIVTWDAYRKRGGDPTDEQWREFKDSYTQALTEIREAAESVEGLFDLPLRADDNRSALVEPKTRVYSEQSPYVGLDMQADLAHEEDRNRSGTSG